MWSTVNLEHDEISQRKVDNKPAEWSDKDFKLVENVNKFHYSPAAFTYRSGNNITKGAKWILIDVDEEGSNVEEKLLEYKLEYIKAPSASATDTITYKWHYFVKTKRLSSNVAIARAQINEFYAVLGLKNIDPSAIDPVRYFAPCGCAEKLYSIKWDKRIKWCNERTVHVKGIKWLPNEEITPIYSGGGTESKPVYINNIDTIEFTPPTDDWEPLLKCNPKPSSTGRSWKLEYMTPISLGGDKWTTAGIIAAELKDGESISNLIGCPGFNRQHKDPSIVGYGYVERVKYKDKSIVFFNCGGNNCKNHTYSLYLKGV